MLKPEISKDDYEKLPELLQKEYVEGEREDLYVLEVEGLVPKGKLAEFRDTNVAVMKERDQLGEQLAAYKKLGTPDEIAEAVEKASASKTTKKDLTAEVERAVNKARTEWEDEAAELRKSLDASSAELRKFKLTNKVRAAAEAAGVDKEYLDDVLILTEKNFDLEKDGGISVVDDDGDPYAGDPERFFKVYYQKRRPHFFKGSEAGGTGTEQEKVRKTTAEKGQSVVSRGDFASLAASVDDIASGKVVVTD